MWQEYNWVYKLMTVSIDYSGKVALVTGASQGIGFATARAFAEAGASVVLADLKLDVAESAARIREAGGDAQHIVCDISVSQKCQRMIEETLATFGRLDFAFNNAGIGSYARPISEVADKDWQRVINVNLSGVFYCIKHQIPAMVQSGGGVIVNNSSVLGVRALPDSSIEYTAAKHGVIGLTRQVAVNHGREGIRCVAVCPGLIETTLVDPDSPGGIQSGGIPHELRQWFLERTAQDRIGKPEDIAGAVTMLCSDQSAFVNGSHLVVDGGLIQG